MEKAEDEKKEEEREKKKRGIMIDDFSKGKRKKVGKGRGNMVGLVLDWLCGIIEAWYEIIR